MANSTPQTRHYWIFSTDPHHYHWDTLFVKGKEMWHGAGSKPDAIRALKQVKRGDREIGTSELQSRQYLVCRLLLEKKKKDGDGHLRESQHSDGRCYSDAVPTTV